MSSKEKTDYISWFAPNFILTFSTLTLLMKQSHTDIKLVYIKKVTFHCDLFRSVKVGPQHAMDKSYT